jgi:hypothetical protein
MGILHEDQYTFLVISRSVRLRMRNVSDKVVEKIANFLCSITVFRKSYIYDIMWKNIVDPGKPQIAIWGVRIA